MLSATDPLLLAVAGLTWFDMRPAPLLPLLLQPCRTGWVSRGPMYLSLWPRAHRGAHLPPMARPPAGPPAGPPGRARRPAQAARRGAQPSADSALAGLVAYDDGEASLAAVAMPRA